MVFVPCDIPVWLPACRSYRRTIPAHTESPFRLYKYMVPTNAGILGHIIIGNNFRAAESQALWAVAYLDHRLSLPAREDTEKEVAMGVVWCRRRYPSKGGLGHWLYFDLVPYTDALLEQLRLESHRKKGISKNFFSPCIAEDLKGLLSEFRRKHNLKFRKFYVRGSRRVALECKIHGC